MTWLVVAVSRLLLRKQNGRFTATKRELWAEQAKDDATGVAQTCFSLNSHYFKLGLQQGVASGVLFLVIS